MDIIKLVFKRLFFGVFVLFMLSFICFAMMYFSNSSPLFATNNQAISKSIKEEIEKNLDLDKSLMYQYTQWLQKALSGDFSNSLLNSQSTSSLISQKALNTAVLGFSSLFVLFVLALFLSILSIMYKNSFIDKAINFVCMSFFAMPSFCTALLLILFFSLYLNLLPSSGVQSLGAEFSLTDRLLHLILPMLSIVLSHLAVALNFIRSILVESLNQHYIEAAFARGLSSTRIYLHLVLKDSFASIITYFSAISMSFLMSIYVIESVFAYDGIGALAINSIIYKDYPVVLAIILLSTALLLLINTAVECLCKFIDNRNLDE